ncbi:MAG: hypothetical protein K8I82_24150 [Anaerolineae bacterium]|nr:hypothetical protein [Anaerolineae bacterium]
MCYEIAIGCSPAIAVRQVTETLRAAGFRVNQFFNLQVASRMHSTCDCPYHGTARCTCQVAVLLVYATGGRTPLTLLIHGHEDQSLIIFTDSLPTDLDLQADVFESLRQVNLIPGR